MDQLTAQCLIFFGAGFDTSASAATLALYELAVHQKVQDKVREELGTVLKKFNNEVTFDSLKELVYLEQVIDGKLFATLFH